MARGQGSTEYLVILGAVMLVTMVVVSVFGWFPALGGPTRTAESQAYWSSASPVSITSIVVTSTSISFRIENRLPKPLTVTSIVFSDGANSYAAYSGSTQLGSGSSAYLINYSFSNGNPCIFSSAAAPFELSDVKIYYAESGLSGLVQAGSRPMVGACNNIGLGSLDILHYVPLELSNLQATDAAANFKQLVNFDPSAYAAYESTDLGNIRFIQNGTNLLSWCASGCSNSSTNATFYVALPSGIPASTTTILNMTFGPLGWAYLSDGNYAGQAPGLSGTYGQYDNGASLFGGNYSKMCPAGGNCGALPQYAGQFNGTYSYLRATSVGVSRTVVLASGLSISAWIKTSVANKYIASQDAASNCWPSCLGGIAISSTGNATMTTYTGSAYKTATGSAVVTDNTWHHVVGEYEASTGNLTVYVDGALSGANYAGNQYGVSVRGIVIGIFDNLYPNSMVFNGSIANVQVYNVSLSASQVLQLYNGGVGGSPVLPASTVGMWYLNGNGTDGSGRGHDATANNMSYSYLLSSPPAGVMPDGAFGSLDS